LDDDMLIRASIELTYSHHAPDTLKTATAGHSYGSAAREHADITASF
jgi:hypothetical protein